MRKFYFAGALIVVVTCIAIATSVGAQGRSQSATGRGSASSNAAKIRNALSAAPPELRAGAAVMDWPASAGGPMKQLRAGKNNWTCLPSEPTVQTAVGEDPMCMDKVFLDWANAYMG